MVPVASTVGEREQIFTISRRIVSLRNEKSGKFGPLSRRRSRSIHNPTASPNGHYPSLRVKGLGGASFRPYRPVPRP